MPLRRLLPLLLAILVAVPLLGLAAAPSASARTKVTIGIGQQTEEIFYSRLWKRLKLPHVRVVAPWDALRDPYQARILDGYMAAAEHADAKVMLGFRASLTDRRRAKLLPSARQFERAFRGIRERYPGIRDYVPWNETNHPTALTGRRPGRVAQYFNVASRVCPRCNVVAADVLDIGNMEWWVRGFLRKVRKKPRLWGLHNYHDANSLTTQGVRRLLRLVPGKIWLTETGGVVKYLQGEGRRRRVKTYGLRRQAAATRHVLDMSKLSRRITRIYIYNWRAPERFTTWDSGLLNRHLKPRRAYRSLRAWLIRARRAGLAR